MARLFYTASSSRRHITLKNIRLALPELNDTERKQTALAAYDHFGQAMAESLMIMAGKLGRKQMSAMVDDRALPALLNIEANTRMGILFITGHFGNFEVLAHYTGMQLNRPANVVARKGSNRLIDSRIVTPLRESFGNNVIFKKRALPRIAKGLKNGEHVGLLIDIKSNSTQGVPVTFFGQKTYAIKSSAYLQIKLGMPVIPIALVRVAPKKYKLITGPQVQWTDNGEPIEAQIAALTQLHQTALESLIRQYPEQWLWMHDRWK